MLLLTLAPPQDIDFVASAGQVVILGPAHAMHAMLSLALTASVLDGKRSHEARWPRVWLKP